MGSSRLHIPKKTQLDLLTKSRRRCAFCFGLKHDASVRTGQIAHVDQNSSNNRLENLAWLCFEHHDQYDSKTRQSKNLTDSELIHYRELLYEFLESKPLRPSGKNGFSMEITKEPSAGVEWTSAIQEWPHAEKHVEAQIWLPPTSGSVILGINGDWGDKSLTQVRMKSDVNHRHYYPGAVARWSDGGASLSLWLKFRRALEGSCVDVESFHQDKDPQKHFKDLGTFHCCFKLEEIESIALWAIGFEFTPGCLFNLS